MFLYRYKWANQNLDISGIPWILDESRYSGSKIGRWILQSSIFTNSSVYRNLSRFCKIRFALQAFRHLGCDLELFVSKFPQEDLRNKNGVFLSYARLTPIFQVHSKNISTHSELKGSRLRRNLPDRVFLFIPGYNGSSCIKKLERVSARLSWLMQESWQTLIRHGSPHPVLIIHLVLLSLTHKHIPRKCIIRSYCYIEY